MMYIHNVYDTGGPRVKGQYVSMDRSKIVIYTPISIALLSLLILSLGLALALVLAFSLLILAFAFTRAFAFALTLAFALALILAFALALILALLLPLSFLSEPDVIWDPTTLSALVPWTGRV